MSTGRRKDILVSDQIFLMNFIPSTWIKICSIRTDFKKISSLVTVLVLSLLCFPIISSACVVTCKSNLNVSLDNSGQALITPPILLQDPSCDYSDFTVDITDPNGISVGNTLTCAHVGFTMTAIVTQTNTGNSCQTLITVNDYIKPQLICVDTVVLCNQSVDPAVIGYPLATDNCTALASTDLMYNDEFMDLACFATHGADTITSQIKRTWSVQDEAGNSNTCIQMIYLKRVTIADVSFPAHRDGFAAPALDCGQDPTNLSITGEPSINGIPLDNAGSCELIASYSDQVVPLCGSNAYRIIRTWTIIDYCSSDFTLNVQIINVEDNIAPAISCPTDITVGTLQNDCGATVNFPLATASDDCSNYTITPSWDFGTGYGPFFDIPLGVYTVTYTAEDDCGNRSSCTMTVTVEDNIPPTPICDYSTTIDLSVFGNAIAYANTFNDGSHDNCEIELIEVSRDGVTFGPYVSFDCNDIENSPVEVTLRVWDTAGNYNECTVNTIVDDKLAPAIACPAEVSISCAEDYNDLTLVGEPIVNDNCSIDTIYYEDVFNVNNCNEGTIIRRWTVLDARGNSNACIQMIHLEDNTPLIVVMPDNYVTSICNADTAVSITGQPTFLNNDCEDVTFSYSDQIFYTSASCYKIFRTWSVYEWCTYNPNEGTNEGFWTDIQIIDVEDNTAPTLTCLGDTTIAMFAANCSGVNINLEVPEATDCNPNVLITNDATYATNSGADASGFYPPGVHTITYTATDECGNYTSCSRTITIVDAKAPTAVCNGGINVNIEIGGTVSLSPEMFDLGSYDNCTASQNLSFAIHPQIFTCEDLGPQQVTLTVTDEAGNSSACITTVTIQNNNNICDTPSAMIAGVIENEKGNPVQLVDLVLSGSAHQTIQNDISGYFEFNELPLAGNYEVTPVKDINPTNGVSTFDLVLMQRHVLGIKKLDSPYKIIAADINRSGGVSTFDLVKLRRLILELDTHLANNTSWRFVPMSYIFPDPTNPFASPFPESIVVNNLETDVQSADFIAIKIGDVNTNATTGMFTEDDAEARHEQPDLQLHTNDKTFKKGESLEIPIYAKDFANILGFQMTFNFATEALAFVEMEGVALENMSEEHFNFSKVGEGLLATSWTRTEATSINPDTPLFILKFNSLKDGKMSDYFKINARWLNTEAYNEEMEILGINFEFSETIPTEKEQFMLYQNYPNPFVETSTVPFYLPQAAQISVEITNAKGMLVQKFEQRYEAGHQIITLNRDDFGAAGIYFFQMQGPNGKQQIKKLIVP